MRHRIQSLVTAILIGAPASARAQATDTQAMAGEQFERGSALRDKGDCKHALPFFRTSQGLDPSRGTLLNLAFCEEKLGQVAGALWHLQQIAPPFAATDGRLAIMTNQIKALLPRIAHLRIALGPGAPAGTVVTLDDIPLAASSLGVAVPVDPGAHTLIVRAPGTLDRRYDRVRLDEGQSEAITVSPGARVDPTPPPPRVPEPAPGPSHGRVASFALTGVGIAGVGTGIALGVVAGQRYSTLLAHCPLRVACGAAVQREAGTGLALEVGAVVAATVGVAGLGPATFLWVRDDGKSVEATVGIAVLPGGGGLGLRGRF